jgi:hypothetical protein
MKITVQAKPAHTCRLTESLCVKDTPVQVELNSTVRRRLRDGSLIKVDDSKEKEPEKKALEKNTKK